MLAEMGSQISLEIFGYVDQTLEFCLTKTYKFSLGQCLSICM